MTAQSIVLDIYSAIEDAKSVKKVARLVRQLLNSSGDENVPVVPVPIAQRHPLGFFALSWPIDQLRVLRLHYWSKHFDWTQSDYFQVHDHTFGFTSAVISGRIRNDIYSIHDDVHGSTLYITSYEQGESRLSPQPDRVVPILESSHSYDSGSFYKMSPGAFHRSVLESDSGLTILATSYQSMSRDGARVIGLDSNDRLAFQRSALDDHLVEQVMFSIREVFRKSIT